MNKKAHILSFAIAILMGYGPPFSLSAQQDTTHYSVIFQNQKPYRIYLPNSYHTSAKNYPVIYFFHGNQGDEKLYFDSLQKWIDKASVILVAWNGRSKPDDMRPYNIGYHSNIIYQNQFKDYFTELVAHIDSTYRTIANRSGRALIGHSMGGFMSFFLAGKYPDMVCAAASLKGSPEFFVGYPQNHTLYQMRYMFKNLYGVKVLFHNGSEKEELNFLNGEVNNGAKREIALDYTYKRYPGPHDLSAAEFKEAFSFTVNALQFPSPKPQRWHHADLYADFKVWDYTVSSNLKEPGFIELSGVTKGGMGIRTRRWQPDGAIIPGVEINVKTAPVYVPGATYQLFDYNVATTEKNSKAVTADKEGRIGYRVNGQYHQVGIYTKNSPAEIVCIGYVVNDSTKFLSDKESCNLKLQLLNRGGSSAKNIIIKISSATKGVVIENPVLRIGAMEKEKALWLPASFHVTTSNKPPDDGSPFMIRFNLVVSDDKGNSWNDEFDAPVMYNGPEFTHIGIDDGDSGIFGRGNGNNTAEPGESIMIYEISNGSRRLRLYYDDPYVEREWLYDEIQPDKWGDGYTLSSIIHISKNCPPGHQIKFLACYEIKDWQAIRRDVTWGIFTITVGNIN